MVTIENLEKELKQGKLNNLYLLYGEETFLLENIVKKIKSNFGELLKGINDIVLEENDYASILSNIEIPAFGYEKKLVLVKQMGLFQKEGKKKNVTMVKEREKLIEYLKENRETIKQTCILVFIEREVEKNDLYQTIEKLGGTICEFSAQKPIQITSRIKAIAKAYHVTIEEGAITYLMECVGTNLQEIINEIRKLIEYVGENGTITKREVDLLTVKQIQAVIFDLTDHLGKRNMKQAMQVLDGLIASKEPIQKILVTLYNHFKKLYLLKIAIKENKDLAQSMKLRPNQLFLVNKYKMQTEYFTEQELRKLVEALIQLDSNYKVGLIDLTIGLEAILCRYCS